MLTSVTLSGDKSLQEYLNLEQTDKKKVVMQVFLNKAFSVRAKASIETLNISKYDSEI